MSTPLLPKFPPESQENVTSDKTLCGHIISELKCISQIAVPTLLMAFALYGKNLVSVFFLGKLDQIDFAGGSLALSFANVFGYSILSGLAGGMEPICGQAFGAGRLRLLGLTLQRAILFLLGVSVGICVLWFYFYMGNIALWLNQREEIVTRAQIYLLYSLLDLFPQSVLHPLRIYLRSQSINNPLFFCAVFSTVLHLPISWFLVSYLNLGIGGVALGVFLTDLNHVSSLLVYIVISGACKSSWPGLTTDCFRDLRPLIKLAIPSCLSTCSEWWFYEIMLFMCGSLDNAEISVSAMGILIQFTGLIYNFPYALSTSVSTRVGNELGANRPEKAKFAARTAVACSFVMGVLCLIVSFLAREYWTKLFSEKNEVLELTATAMFILGLCEIGNCPQTTGYGVLRGAARPKTGMCVNFVCFYLIGLSVSWWFGFRRGLGLIGVLFGLLAAEGSCAVAMAAVLCRMNWEEQAKRAQMLTGCDYVGDDFAEFSSSPSPYDY